MHLPTHAPETSIEGVAARLAQVVGDGLIETVTSNGQLTARVKPESWVATATAVKEDPGIACKLFSWLSAIHWIGEASAETQSDEVPEADDATAGETAETELAAESPQPGGGHFDVIARLARPESNLAVFLRSELPEDSATIPSLTGVFAGANWHERECHEMFGIDFEGHPELEKLYLPEDFEGHPLLKSFPLGARDVKPWPGDIDVEGIPPEIEARLDAQFGGSAPADSSASDDTGGSASAEEGEA